MWWLLFWACLLLVSGVYVGARVRGLWGQTKELGSELAVAERRLDAVQGQLDVLGERIGGPEQLAVFSDVASARKERDRARTAGYDARQQRLAVSHPMRVKHVD
jgi:hypothetical protein